MRAAEQGRHGFAVRVMRWFVVALAAVLVVTAALEWLLARGGSLTVPQLALGLAFLASAGISWLAQRRGAVQASAALLLFGGLLALTVHSWQIGLGVHTVGLAGIATLIALAGATAGLTVASVLAATYALVVAVLSWAEFSGHLPGQATAAALPLYNRITGHLLLATSGWLVALLLYKMVGRTLTQAVGEAQRAHALLRIGSDWDWEADARGRITYVSESFEAATGRRPEEAMQIGQPGGPRMLRDADSTALLEAVRARLPCRDLVCTLVFPDGAQLSVRGAAEPRLDGQGRFIGWSGVARNITAERAAQQAKRHNEAMMRSLVDMSPDAIMVGRTDNAKMLLANAGFLAMVGRPASEVLGKSGFELGFWRDEDAARRIAATLRDGGIVKDLRSRVHLPDGRTRDVLISAAGIDWHGAAAALMTVRDITDVDRARMEIEAILDNAVVGIAQIRDGRYERANPTWEAIFGHPEGSLVGQPTTVMFANRDEHDRFVERLYDEYRRTGMVDIEREFPRPDGSTVEARVRVRAVDPGRPEEADVTERRRAERELAAAKREAEAANAAKSAFLATMSHEIRTPLNGVLGLSRMLQDPALDAVRRQEYLVHLTDAAELLTGIVSDVLDLAKIEAGQMQVEQIEFDLAGVVSSTFHTFAPLGRERGLDMQCVVGAGVPKRVRSDPVRVRQILANYLTNALKFTPKGGITVRVGPGLDGRVRITVADTGVGIAPELRERLFTPFTQADSSTTRRFGGSGLGLSICRQIAQRMGGDVGVDSDGLHGSSFWAELRLDEVFDERSDTERRAADVSNAQALAGLQVLVAEDNPVNMLIVRAMLEKLGVQVLAADDGQQAFELATQHASTLGAVLMDLHMPVIDGLTAARMLRADPVTAHLPVLALSAAVLEHERQAACAAGMMGFIGKPVVEAELLRALEPLVRRADEGSDRL
jgi:PAS domain S-box-containing protein